MKISLPHHRRAALTLSAGLLSGFPLLARADEATTDLASLTANVNFAAVSTAVLAIAGTLAAVFVTIRGAKLVLSMIRGS